MGSLGTIFRRLVSFTRPAFAAAVALAAIVAAAQPRQPPRSAAISAAVSGAIAVALAVAAARRARSAAAEPAEVGLAWLMTAAAVLLAMPAAGLPNAYFQRWWPPALSLTGAMRSGAVRWLAITLVAVLLWPRLPARVRPAVLWTGLALAVALSAAGLLQATEGRPLYRDDHPSFLFRLWLLRRSLPVPAAWVPFWEAGHVDTSPASTGAALLGLPLWLAGVRAAPHEFYTLLVAITVIVLPSLFAALGARLAGAGPLGAASAGLLALGVSRGWYVWMLRFGTVPAGISAAAFPLAAGVAARILGTPRPGPALAAAWTGTLVTMMIWPLGAVMTVPAAVGLLLEPALRTRRRFLLFLGGTLAAALCLAPFAWTLHAHAGVGEFLERTHTTRNIAAELVRGTRRLASLATQSHPLLVALGLAGAALWPDRSSRRLLWIGMAGLALLTGWGDVISPQLQLHRAELPLLMLAVLPASWLLDRALGARTDPTATIVAAAAIGLLTLGGYEAVQLYRNRTNTPYAAMGEELPALASWIADHVPPGARVMFAGPTVHAYGGGHVAYLPVLSGRSMLACDFYHFSPAQREYEYPPKAFRRTDDQVFEFLDLHNVAAVITYHSHWIRFFRRHPDRFIEAASFGRDGRKIAFLLRRPPPGLFFRNSGQVEELVNGLNITLDKPAEPALLRYRWSEGLIAEPPARAHAVQGPGGLDWLGIEPNGVRRVRVRWSPLGRKPDQEGAR
ncbi:MAG: hypothetical protein N2652_08770 [Kiritimatiellae bacterium]|nr:hypothetical protein [Kiritimatiellia bacterium]